MGRKLTKDEYLQKRVFPLLERAHRLCSENEIALFFAAQCSDECGVLGIVASNEEGVTIPFAQEMIALRKHHELMSSGVMDAIHDVILRQIKKEHPDCTGDCAECLGKSEVDA